MTKAELVLELEAVESEIDEIERSYHDALDIAQNGPIILYDGLLKRRESLKKLISSDE